MKWYVEESLRNFPFWSGAKDTANELTLEDIDTIEEYLQDQEMSDTEINDFFWFENDTIAEWLGYSSWERMLWERGNGKSDAINFLAQKYPDCDDSYIEEWVNDNWDINSSDDWNAGVFESDAIGDGELPNPDEAEEGDDDE